MAQNILKKFQTSARLLDDMIFRLETNLGRPHTVSPFPSLYSRYHFSTTPAVVEEPTKKVEEEKKVEPAKIEVATAEPAQEKKPEDKKAAAAPKKPQAEGGKKKGAPAAQEAPKIDEVWEVYSKCDLRVGKIVECVEHPESEHLYKERIDLGEGEPRVIGSGLKGKIPIDEMLSGYVVVFANLKPRKLAGFMSNGMVMCASNADHSVVELVRPPEGSKIGDRIQLTGNPILGAPLPEAFEAELNPKKKYAERFLEKLVSNGNCEATYNGVTLTTSAGILKNKSLTDVHIA